MQYQKIDASEINELNRTAGVDLHLRGTGSIDIDYYMARAKAVRAAETAQGLRAIRKAIAALFA